VHLARTGVMALGWMALAALLFASMSFFARLASSDVPWATIAATRALVGAAVAYAVARARGTPLVTRDGRATWMRSLFGTASMTATFYALSSRTLPLGDTVCLLSLTPVFLALLAPMLLGERTRPHVAIAIVVSLTGVVLILRPAALFGGARLVDRHVGGPTAQATAWVAILAALLSAIAMMMLRRVGQREHPEAIALHFSLFAAAVMTALALRDLFLPSPRDALFMLLAGLSGGMAQLALTRAYTLDHASRVGAMGYLSVVTSALLGAIALHDRPNAVAMAGMGLVVSGGIAATLAGRRGPA
jgi:drug/metabolite transporter (DMT)-like permease